MNSSTLYSVKVTFTGTGTNITNVKLWESSNDTFGSDVQIGSTQSYASTVTFGSLSSSIPYPGVKYYFVTFDLGESDGTLIATIATTSDISCSSSLSTSISNAPLSSSGVPLPVELSMLNAECRMNNVELKWKTETEVNNYGFEIERKKIATSNEQQATSNQSPINQLTNHQWLKVGFVSGAGTSNSPKEYSFAESKLPAGRYAYRLKQIDLDGAFKYSQSVEIEISAPKEFALLQNYPNPFNPATVISYQLPVVSNVNLKVYDILGKEVATLVNGMKEPSTYEVQFDASHLASGVYFYKLTAHPTDGGQANNFTAVKKLLLMK
jgi:hypothetical protein